MCGIAGIVQNDMDRPVPCGVINLMCEVMRHRGPDEEGYFVNKNVALGMRRLKVIDLSTGSQPVFNEDRTIVTVFNGEIYNFRRLKSLLQCKGHSFSTESDTEVIVHLYEEYGEDFLRHLNGMFAIALWDDRRKTLLLARDRLGEKPLHYAVTDEGIIFSSEIKSILSAGIDREIDYEALYHYFSFICVPAPLTIFKNVKKLHPGHYLKYRDGKTEIRKYWELKYEPDFSRSEEEFSAELRALMSRSIRDRLISDVPLGAFLSGGIDSTVVVGLMSEAMDRPVKTFSIGFKEDKYNELEYARIAAKRFKTEHHEFVVEARSVDLLEELVWHFDEPFAGPSAVPTYIVSKLARQFVTVVLTGDGGDEIFGGYDSYRERLKRKKLSLLPSPVKEFISRRAGSLPGHFKGKGFLESLAVDEARLHFAGRGEQWKRDLFSGDFYGNLRSPDSFDLARGHLLNDSAEYLSRFMYLDTKFYLPDNVLVKVDRMSMANSLETRALFLDHEIVEFAARIPAGLKLNKNASKYILKKSAGDLIPPEIMNRNKWGFALPVDVWFRGELKGIIGEAVERSKKGGIFNHDYLKARLDEHLSGGRNHQRLLWAYMIFDLWQERCLKFETRSHTRLHDYHVLRTGE